MAINRINRELNPTYTPTCEANLIRTTISHTDNRLPPSDVKDMISGNES
ncbi:hypothetical protein C8J31_1474 [Rhizobium sp. PP-CC-2G-626]|nr:hypothetical protein C8J31_1474 [Rhizobium sp. PP-CC-2G-626]